MKVCPKCSYTEEDNSIPYCTYCGYRINVTMSDHDTIDEIKPNRLQTKKLTKKVKVSIIGFVFIGLMIGTSFLISSPLSPIAPSLTVTNASTSPTDFIYYISNKINYTLAYTLTMSLKFNFPLEKKFHGPYLGCLLDIKLIENSNWVLEANSYKGCFSRDQNLTGSYNLTFQATIYPSNSSYENVNYPLSFSFLVTAERLGLKSNLYRITINKEGYSHIVIAHLSINNDTNDIGQIGYNIRTDFFVVTDHNIELTNTCSPFSLNFNPSFNWTLSVIGCQSSIPNKIPIGGTSYTINSQITDPNGNLYNYSPLYNLPNSFDVQVKLPQYSLESSPSYVHF